MTEIETARAAVNAETFGTPEWEAAMAKVRALVAAQPTKPSLNVRLVNTRSGYRAIRA
jgi:hypothetical protein